jgi:hypothetical protein
MVAFNAVLLAEFPVALGDNPAVVRMPCVLVKHNYKRMTNQELVAIPQPTRCYSSVQSSGVPIQMHWECQSEKVYDLDFYEYMRPGSKRRNKKELSLSVPERARM